MKHGASAYRSRRACRCAVCTEDHRARRASEYKKRKAKLAVDPSLAAHGSKQTYKNWGCRCRPCTDANAAHSRAYAAKRRGGVS